MNEPLVSVFVTSYNSERTIKRCIDSILNQKYKNIELIIIDDFSEDKTRDIINKYFDNRIVKVFLNSNHGPSHSKLKGLSLCKGRYILNCDSDDYFINSNVINRCVEIMENNRIDMLNFSYVKEFKTYSKEYKLKKRSFITSSDFDKTKFLLNSFSKGKLFRNLFSKCIRRDCIKAITNNLPTVKIADDYFISFLTLPYFSKITTTDEILYAYESGRNTLSVSAVESEAYNFKSVEEYLKIRNKIKEKFEINLIKYDLFLITNLISWPDLGKMSISEFTHYLNNIKCNIFDNETNKNNLKNYCPFVSNFKKYIIVHLFCGGKIKYKILHILAKLFA